MPADLDFQPYLRSISVAYEKWWELYTLTDLETDRASSSPFGFELMVETVTRPGRDGEEKRDRVPVLKGLHDYVARETHVLLVGRPGSGKSTVLARVLLGKASSEEKERIPVLVELRSWKTSVLDLIRDFFHRHDLLLTTDQVRKLLADDRLFLLVDGLNELPSDAARQDVETLRNYRRVPMIFTTRDLSLGGDFGIQRQLQMQPLTEPQMQALIRAYVRPDQAEAMWRQITEGLRKFAETPLLLWMLCELFKVGGTIPKNLGEVFQAFVQAYENKSIRKSEVAALKGDVQPLSDRRLWSTALKHLAAVMMRGEKPVDLRTVISRDEATRELMVLFGSSIELAANCVADLEKYHLLQVRSDNDLEFHHQLFQEYYAAEWLLDRLEMLTDRELQQEYLNYLKWTEPVAMMLALVKEETLAVQVARLGLEVDLMLGARLAGEVKLKFQEITVEILMRRLTYIAPTEPDWLKLKLLKATGSRAVISYLIPLLDSPDDSTRRYANLALLMINPEAVPEESRASKESKWIQQLLDQASESLKTEAVSPAHPPEIVEALSPDVRSIFDSWISNELSSSEVIEKSSLILKDSDSQVQHSIVGLLGILKSEEGLPLLFQVLEASESSVCHRAAIEIGRLGFNSAIPELTKIIEQHPTSGVRHNAVLALRIIGSEEVITGLLHAMQDSDFWVRHEAVEASEKIDSEAIIPGLLSVILDPNFHLSRLAAHKIRTLSVKESILKALGTTHLHALVAILSRPDIYIRWLTALALWNAASEEVIPLLRPMVNHSDWDVGLSAALVLGKFGCEDAAPGLTQIMDYSNLPQHPDIKMISYKAAYALSQIRGDKAAQYLPELTKLVPSGSGEDACRAIAGIQKPCNFYNYEIWQAYLTAQQTDRPASQACDRPSTINNHFPNAIEVKIFEQVDNYHQTPAITQNFNGPVYGVAGNVEGDQITPPANSVD